MEAAIPQEWLKSVQVISVRTDEKMLSTTKQKALEEGKEMRGKNQWICLCSDLHLLQTHNAGLQWL